jgi:hypothetical protein
VFEPVVSLSAAARICIKCAQAKFRVHALNDSMQMLFFGTDNRNIDKRIFAFLMDWALE